MVLRPAVGQPLGEEKGEEKGGSEEKVVKKRCQEPLLTRI
jgi:hypothetical protein